MEKQKTAVALGFFDGVHKGHQKVIEKAVELAGKIHIPAVFTFIMDGTGPAKKQNAGEIITLEQKKRILTNMGIRRIYAPAFTAFRDLSGEEFVQKILLDEMNAAAVCCGRDFRFGKGASCGVGDLMRFCEEKGIACEVLEEVLDEGETVSSTRVRRAIAEGQMEKAAALLGWRYTVDFPVEHGKALGRKLSFPTINQSIPAGLLLPRFGVYATMTEVEGRFYPGVTNIGVRPTVEEGMAPRAETYLIGFKGDLYGKIVPVRFLSFLRPEEKFDSVEELKTQIAKDAKKAEEIAKNALQSPSAML